MIRLVLLAPLSLLGLVACSGPGDDANAAASEAVTAGVVRCTGDGGAGTFRLLRRTPAEVEVEVESGEPLRRALCELTPSCEWGSARRRFALPVDEGFRTCEQNYCYDLRLPAADRIYLRYWENDDMTTLYEGDFTCTRERATAATTP